jgi:hypothetical protein
MNMPNFQRYVRTIFLNLVPKYHRNKNLLKLTLSFNLLPASGYAFVRVPLPASFNLSV